MLAHVSADERETDHEEERSRRRTPEIVSDGPISIPFGATKEQSPVERLASGIGNSNFTQIVQRMADGEGILAGGTIHPDVTRAIAAMSGGGSPLPTHMARKLEATHGDLSDARVHTGPEAAALSRIEETALTVAVEYPSFDDWWEPFTLGVGPAGGFTARLDAAGRAELEQLCRARLRTAPFTISARAWAARRR